MDENILNDALNMAGAEEGWEIPPFIDPDMVAAVSTAYATYMVSAQEEASAEDADEIIRTTIAAAYIAGRLEASTLEAEATNQPQVTVTGKSGTNVNIYIS